MEYVEKKYPTNLEFKLKDKNQIEIDNKQNATDNTSVDVLYTPCMDATSTQDDVKKKILSLKHLLEKEIQAADLKWCFFVAACNTYRYDTCLRPFPPMYVKNECKDIEALRKAVEIIPPLTVIFQELHKRNAYDDHAATIELLYWVLVRLRDPHIKSMNRDSYEAVLRRLPSEMPVAEPNLIFQVASAKQSTMEERWKTIAQGHSSFYAYHGSRLENFHSIIHYGLQQTMCKRSLFSKGIYLSSELGVSLPYSPVGYGWGGSIFGSELSCVALCELVDHPDVKRGNAGNTQNNVPEDSEIGEIPEKYCLVTNSELVRIRYLLIYRPGFKPMRNDQSSGLLAWFKQHKLLTFVLGYVVLLASVGLTHNKQVEKYYRLFVQKAGLE